MRDSLSPRHFVPSSTGHTQPHRPPFSPTNPKNVTNRTTTTTSSIDGGDYHHHHSSTINSNDPWKVNQSSNNKFPKTSSSSSTTKLLPPNPEGRMIITNHPNSATALTRVTSAPTATTRRTLARGRLMEGPTPAVADTGHIHSDDPTAWPTTTNNNNKNDAMMMMMNDDSTWFVGDGDMMLPTADTATTTATSKNRTTANTKTSGTSSSSSSSIPSPFHWGRRSRSNNDVGNSYNSSSNSSSNIHANHHIPTDPHFSSTTTADPWRLSQGTSADSGERSLYDDSGEKIIRHTRTTPTTHRKSLISPKTTFVPLGSPARPIATSDHTTSNSDFHRSRVPDGSLNRPIAIHDIDDDGAVAADGLDEREQDVLQHASRKQNGPHRRFGGLAGVGAATMNQNDGTIIMVPLDDDIRDSDILQKATKRRQGLLEKKKQQQVNHENENIFTAAIPFHQPIVPLLDMTKIETSPEAVSDQSTKQSSTPKQNKGLLGFFRGGVRIKK